MGIEGMECVAVIISMDSASAVVLRGLFEKLGGDHW